MSLLVISIILGLFLLHKKKNIKSNLSIYVYICGGFLFEILFMLDSNGADETFNSIYHIVFPFLISVSMITRITKNIILSNLLFLVIMSLIYCFIEYYNFIALNYTLSILTTLFVLIKLASRYLLNWNNLIDVLIALNLYFMSIASLVSTKVQFWSGSQFVVYMQIFVSFLLFLTLILINVKFWRSIAH